MKKTFLLIAAFGSLATVVNAQKKPVKKPVPAKVVVAAPVLKNALDSFSYAAGLNIATSMKQQGISNINAELVQRAMDDVFKSRTALLTEEQAGMTLQQKLQEFAQKRMAEEKAKGTAYLATNAKRTGVTVLPSGLQYEVLKAGEPGGIKPSDVDTVVVHYIGTLIDGTKFDASIDKGAPITYPVTGFIRGWTEALQLMTKGAKWRIAVPSELGYGERGSGAIGPNAALIFELELLDVIPGVKQ
ncbi:MAG: FKBP-type peptidyl-prolyl cis-trans isomerase [Chitinophagaceae bacterium]|nr:MAG: FKBP-type peptidyl-prolyl cis-trans isomerase [Chitinophagaceae bacterium]